MGLVTHSTSPRIKTRIVFYEGTGALLWGQGVCYNRDYYSTTTGTLPADACGLRDRRVEDPTTSNMQYFAGVTRRAYAANATGQWIEICEPGSVCEVYTDQSCTLATTVLSMNTSGIFTANDVGIVEALALQTVNRSSDNGVVMALLSGIVPAYSCYGTAADRGPSPLVWASCPWDKIASNPGIGRVLWDDFHCNVAGVAAGTLWSTNDNTYQTFIDTGDSIAIATDVVGNLTTSVWGGATLTTDTTDNDQCVIGTPVGWIAGGTTTYLKPWWFEARVKLGSIADTISGCFCGLQKGGNAVTDVPLLDAGTLAIRDLIGFWRDEDDGNAWATVHSLDSGAIVTLAAAAAVPDVNYHKLGMMFDGTSVYFFYDGVLLDDSVLASATNFPDDKLMGPCFGINNATSTAATATIDWWKMATVF
jgi:hypothetical protein